MGGWGPYQPAQVLEADIELVPPADLPPICRVDIICGETEAASAWGWGCTAVHRGHTELPGCRQGCAPSLEEQYGNGQQSLALPAQPRLLHRALTKDSWQPVGVWEVVALLGLPPARCFGRSRGSHRAGARPEESHHEGLLGAGPTAAQQPHRARLHAEPCRDRAGHRCGQVLQAGTVQHPQLCMQRSKGAHAVQPHPAALPTPQMGAARCRAAAALRVFLGFRPRCCSGSYHCLSPRRAAGPGCACVPPASGCWRL